MIDECGDVIYAYKNLTTIFECTPKEFFDYFNEHAPKGLKNDKMYYNQWLAASRGNVEVDIPYSNVYAVENLIKQLPEHCNLHLSILNSIRLSQYYELPKGTKIYANVGTDGIDGCMSTFFGQAAVCEKDNFLIIGDLSFFYDMSSLRIKHNRSNFHRMLVNNHGGNEFYMQKLMPTTPQGLGASHNDSAKAWAESVGFTYMTASNKEEYDQCIKQFVKKQDDAPILFEVFTDQMEDRETVFALKGSYRKQDDEMAQIKETVKSVIGESTVKGIKKLFGK